MDTIVPQKYCYACNQTKPLSDFTNNRSRSDGKASECRACKKQAYAEYKRPKSRNYTTKAMRTVGFSRKDYQQAYEQQNGKCAICGNPETGRNQWGVKKLAVDHEHSTGEFRGLLCQSCNVKLGILEDVAFVSAAQEYLSKHNKLLSEWPEGGRLL